MAERKVTTTCLKCGETITLDFTGVSFVEALSWINKFDKQSYECPGYHVELGGWKKFWNMEEALQRAYSDDEKEAYSRVPTSVRVCINDRTIPFTTVSDARKFARGYFERKDAAVQENAVIVVEVLNFRGDVLKREELRCEDLVETSERAVG